MRTKKEIDDLSIAIAIAEKNYRNAVEANIKEYGKEIPLNWDDEDEDGLVLSVRGDDNDLNEEVVDKVRWNEKEECVEYHLVRFNYKKDDHWYNVTWLGDEVYYIYDSIDWDNIK